MKNEKNKPKPTKKRKNKVITLKNSHNPQPNTPKKEHTKFYADRSDMFFFKQKPINDAFLDRLATEYIEWGLHDDTALVLTDFYLLKGIYPKSFYNLVKRHEGLRKAHNVVKTAVSSRREKGAIHRKFDVNMIRASMPMYSDGFDDSVGWKGLGEWHARLKNIEEEKAKRDIIAVFGDYKKIEKKEDK